MMEQSEYSIVAENLSKRYLATKQRFQLRHQLLNIVNKTIRQVQAPQNIEPFYALKNLSFKMRPTEQIALIGQNGAGKTTLLSLLSRITKPTTGSLSVNGSFMPMISLAAGFNGELTGLQNIYLNTAIRGISHAQVDEVIPEIIEFSELDHFIYEPIKGYSAGMKARLAFSIAIKTLPDILFIDEALSVGDIAFQEKCQQHIRAEYQNGRTIILVSHSMATCQTMCSRGIWLHKGELMMDDDIDTVVKEYMRFAKG